MNEVYVVHEVIPYEFGVVRGVFSSQQAAVQYAETLVNAEELTVSRWLVSDGGVPREEVEVWEGGRRKDLTEPLFPAKNIPNE